MEVEFSLIPEDFVELSEYQLGKHLKWWTLWQYVVPLIFLPTLGVLLIARGVEPTGIMFGLFLPVFAIIAYLIYYLDRRRIHGRMVRKEMRQGKNAALLEPFKLKISPDGISQSSAHAAGMTMWTGLEKIAVTKDHAFFFVSTTAAIILPPRRAFANDQEFTDFVETAQRYFEAANKESVPA